MTTERTLTPEEAKTLGFKPPVPPEQRSGNKTRIVGYFNSNTYPVVLNVCGRQLMVQQRGDYLVDENGVKINDPRIRNHVAGPGLLSVEESNAEIDIVWLATAAESPRLPHGFGGSSDASPNAAASIRAAGPQVPPSASTPSSVGLSMEEARRLGIISSKPGRTSLDSLDDAPADVAKGVIDRSIPIPSLNAPARAHSHENKPNAEIKSHAENKAQQSIVDSLKDASDEMSGVVDSEDATKYVLESVQKAVPKLAVPPPLPKSEPVKEVAEPLNPPPHAVQVNAPEITGQSGSRKSRRPGSVAPRASGPDSEDKNFVCPPDGKAFKYRSELVRHLDRYFPNLKDAVLAKYPAPKKSGE